MEDLEALIQEPAGGHNHGHASGHNESRESLDTRDWQAGEFLAGGGWTIVAGNGEAGAGMVAHRGTVHPEEHVDSETLRALVENELGFTYAEIHSVYRRGPVAGNALALRGRIDTRVLELADAGGNVVGLGRALGFAINESGNCRTLDNALARARALREETT